MDNRQNAISIEDVLTKDEYIVPIYQRNYEWEKPQIAKLIQDIDDSTEDYFLGTLVTFKRGNTYELIDGQQRHTTLNAGLTNKIYIMAKKLWKITETRSFKTEKRNFRRNAERRQTMNS